MNIERILLVSPHGNTPNRYFPLSLGYLKSNLPDKYETRIFDGTFENAPAASQQFQDCVRKFKPDIVGITVYSVTCLEAMKTARVCKEINPDVVTIFGGPHPSTFPDLTMENPAIDYLFRGEAELSFPAFLNRLASGGSFDGVAGLTYRQDGRLKKNDIWLDDNLDAIRIPDYRALRLDEYIARGYFYGGSYGRTAPIWVTRGCPYRCAYCSASLINGVRVRLHSIDYMVDWIDFLYKESNIRQFTIIDDNFTYHIEFAKEFCRRMIALRESRHFAEKIRFTTPNGIRMERIDDELLALMKRAGWEEVGIAPESGSKRTLKRMRKTVDPDKVPAIVDRIKAAGLAVRGFFIVGYPGETGEDIRATIKLIRTSRFDAILIGRFFPVPGTPVFDELVSCGEIAPDYLPRDQNIPRPFQNEIEEGIYTPRAFKKGLRLFTLVVREHVLLALRNPYSVVFFIRYNGGIVNIIKRLMFVWLGRQV